MNGLAEIVGDSSGIRQLREQLEQVLKRAATAARPPAVLLRGETGTGKGLVARTMHGAGPRARAPFVDVNCAAIPDNLLEAELFGYERGAFTDARQAKPGLFQLAHRGMLFLDEIGMLSPALQAKLLKVLEDGAVRRLGGTRTEAVDVWIVSATNEDLREALRARRFREDLYHRLAVLSVELPPLRERGADIMLLAERFLSRACADYGLPPKTFARDARAALAAHAWPGNVRELGNVIERVALLGDEPLVTAAMLALEPASIVDDRPAAEEAPARSSRDQLRAHLLETLTETGWNITQTALRLGVARNTVLARMARFGLRSSAASRPSARPAAEPRPDAAALAPAEPPASPVAPSRTPWEPRRVALLRVDVAAGRAIDELIGKVHTFGGEILEVGPGALVAVFGMEAVEDAPVRAALAALAILKAHERSRGDGAGLGVKIVVHVAPVLVSRFQGAEAIDLDSKKAAWATLEALIGHDERDSIVVSEAAAPFLERRFELTATTSTEAGAVPFRLLTRRERTGFGLGGRPLSRFVGRDREQRLVTDRLADAARGQGQVVGIVGEPGVGKSRFVYELTRLDATRAWRVLACGGASYASKTALRPFGDLLRRYFAIDDADGHEAIRGRATETIMSRHEALESHLTPLISLLDIPIDDPSWSNVDPVQRRQRIQDAVRRLLLHESRIQPLLLIVEDLHWIDGETQALLDELVESLPTARLLLLVTYRHEYQHGWGSKTYYSQLRLDVLRPQRAVELLHALLGDDPGLQPLTRLLVKRGNPFFIEESVRALGETGALIGAYGAYRLTRPVEAIEVPATVQTILAARIERLSTDDKRLLQTASVIGKDVPVVLLRAVVDAAEEDVQRGLAHLRAAEFLYETRLPPDAEYTFKHALTQDVAYGTLPEDRRTELHARTVGAIERLYPDRLTAHVERLADHAVRGELWDKAVTYLHQAGLRDAARSANREAVRHFEGALEALAHRPESRETLERAIDLRFDLKTSLFPLGTFARIVDYLRQAEGLARTLDDRRRLGQAFVHMCHVLGIAGRPPEAIAFGNDARTLAESLGDVPLQVSASLDLGAAYLWTGDYRSAEGLLLNVLQLLDGERSRERFGLTAYPAVAARGHLVLLFADQGKFEQGIAHGQEGIRLAEAVDHPYSLAIVCWCLAYLHISRGDLRHADDLLERGLALAREFDLTYFSAGNTATLGYAHALSGRPAEGLGLLERALTFFETMGNRVSQSLFLGYLSEARVLAGRLEDALESASRALARAREGDQRGDEARALRLLGDVAVRSDFPNEAETHYRGALAIADKLGMRPLAAHCHLGLGTLYRRAGTREQAREHLTIATTMYREMDMRFWLDAAAQVAYSETAG